VGRLTLKLGGLSPAGGESLARRVAEELAMRSPRPGTAPQVESLRQKVRGLPGESLDSLSSRIVDELIRSIERMV
jgi:hypothetical protein